MPERPATDSMVRPVIEFDKDNMQLIIRGLEGFDGESISISTFLPEDAGIESLATFNFDWRLEISEDYS